MMRYRFTPCGCGRSNHRLMPRHGWMRIFVGRRYYRCKECDAAMLLRTQGSQRLLPGRTLFFVVLALVIVAWASFHIVGYLEERSYASGKSRAESQ